jgi:hypothetical protein
MKVLLLLLLGLLTACTAVADAPADTPKPTATPRQPAPAQEDTPTATPLPPTPTSLATATATPSATATATPQPVQVRFAYAGEDPVVGNEPTATIANKYINPGGVTYYDGLFHMLFNSFSKWPGLVEVGYLTSPDGLTWRAAQPDPVFTSDDVPYVRQGADVSSLVVTADGTWMAYFHTVNSGGLDTVIGRATAPAPQGPWTFDPEPLLEPGAADAWDSRGLAWPSVVRTEEGYFMYYAGSDNRGTTRVGLATSPDGITWTKYDDPATDDAVNAASDPVLAATADWESGSVDRMRVANTPDGWVMLYQGGPLTSRGLATSPDGFIWTPLPDNPILTAADLPLAGNMWDTALAYAGGTTYYFTEIGSLSGTNIYVATYEGTLR